MTIKHTAISYTLIITRPTTPPEPEQYNFCYVSETFNSVSKSNMENKDGYYDNA